MPLAGYGRGFPPPARLHPFESALLELTVGPGTYERTLAQVDALRRATVEVRGRGEGAWGRGEGRRDINGEAVRQRPTAEKKPPLCGGGCHDLRAASSIPLSTS